MTQSFKNWPLLDKSTNTLLGKRGVWFARSFALTVGLVLYYYIRAWSVLGAEDLKLLGIFGIVVIPLASWLLGGGFGELTYMSFECAHWIVKKKILVRKTVKLWLCTGVSIFLLGLCGIFYFDPFVYGFFGSLFGILIVGRMLILIWTTYLRGIPDPRIFQKETLSELVRLAQPVAGGDAIR